MTGWTGGAYARVLGVAWRVTRAELGVRVLLATRYHARGSTVARAALGPLAAALRAGVAR